MPTSLTIDRQAREGAHPLLAVFSGLAEAPAFARYPGPPEAVRSAADHTSLQVTPGPGWMYVAPVATPPEVRAAGYEMFTAEADTIVVAAEYLRTGAALDLYLDILHEFLHILQRRAGRELWPAGVEYVDRATEVEAYAFSLVEARRLAVPDAYLRKYLEVSWVSATDHRRLLRKLGL